ncbi:hypothetical protein RND81_04G178000 [Saponaria officinalis]|uniref:Uncharacterized protein n=1 Tax=Saponaria officinalis TaxID=3572 RepID=A0AAW1LF86_SAPOF
MIRCLRLLYNVLFVFHVIKQRMQTGQFASAPEAVRLIVVKEGFKGLYAVFNIFSLFSMTIRLHIYMYVCVMFACEFGTRLRHSLLIWLQGYRSFLLRDLPFDAIQFCLYEQLRFGYKLAAKRDLNDPENAIIGAFAGTE